MKDLIYATESALRLALEAQQTESYEDFRTYIQAAIANLKMMKEGL